MDNIKAESKKMNENSLKTVGKLLTIFTKVHNNKYGNK